MALAILGLSTLFFFGHFARAVFKKTKIPDLLIVILLGYFVGPFMGWISADDFGQIGSVMSTVALVVILYEGGLYLKARDLLSSSWPALKLTITAFLMFLIVTFLIAMIIGFREPSVAFLLALCLSSTTSAVVIPLVRILSVKDSTKTILSLESAITDILTIVLFLVAVAAISSGEVKFDKIAMAIGPNTITAIVFGFGSALIWCWVRKNFSEIMPKAFAGEAFALTVYAMLEVTGFNGALGVLAYGFTLGNLNLLPKALCEHLDQEPIREPERALLSEISNLLRTFFFLYLGILIQLTDWATVGIALFITIGIYITRYFAVNWMFKPKDIYRVDAMTMVEMGPRGLAAAVLATLPAQMGIPGAMWIQDVAFAVILFSIIATAGAVIIVENSVLRGIFSKFFIRYDEAPLASKD